MKTRFKYWGLLSSLFFSSIAYSQSAYQYALNLNDLEKDVLHVALKTPAVKGPSALFSFPKIIPGTYSIADYGKFVSNVKALDKNGKALPINRINDNQWKIGNASQLSQITYTVDDIFDAGQKHAIYPMAATNFEAGKNIVLNFPGILGFIEGLRNVPFEINLQKPSNFYGSTSLQPLSSTATTDVFRVPNLDVLYDSPIMYSIPDTATVAVGNCQVLVSVYSPNKQLNAKEIAGWMSELLDAARQYLGGRLPADKYAFIYYFRDPKEKHSFSPGLGGALEHTTSSFYYVAEAPAANLRNLLVDISSHEFFHIITPLTIASKEVKEFNFNEAIISKHLWLYEGLTEYTAHHVQVKYGLNTVPQFLDKLSQKITTSRSRFNDSLPFTELSKHSAGKWAEQYGNVYQKGALISACLDLYLLHLSKGTYNLRNLTYDLGVRFGKYRYFNDEELFDNIAELTYPEVKEFLQKYVAGSTPIPYEYYFGLAGIDFSPRAERQSFSFGSISMAPNAKGVITINSPFNPNEFGKKMGYKAGDEVYSFNGIPVNSDNVGQVVTTVREAMKEGVPFTARVGRLNSSGSIDTVLLSAPVTKVTTVELNKLLPNPGATAQQLLVRQGWLTAKTKDEVMLPLPAADATDAASVDAITNALYKVISGPAGPRNWERFYSLFLPGAQMGASINNATGSSEFHSITPKAYQKSNGPFFLQSGFYEEELGRTVTQYGNIASIQSAYQFRLSPGGKVEQRGINYITLVKSGTRWYIANLLWQEESKDLPLPASLLKK